MRRFPNWYWSRNRFFAMTWWRDAMGPIAIWPALTWDDQAQMGAKIRGHRWVLAWWRWRCTLDVAREIEPTLTTKNFWSGTPASADEFLKWSRKKLQMAWTRESLARLMQNAPHVKEIVQRAGFQHHYIQILISRALVEQEPPTR